MAIETKLQLSASNAASFPDNTSGFITPALLRNFNTSSIDSYAALSGSNTFVGNQVITGSVIATSFTGSLQGTASWANNATTASHALNVSSTGSLLTTASVSNDIITFTKGNNTTFNITVNNVQNSSTASVISVGGDNTNASRKIVFVDTTIASLDEQLLIAANAPDLTYNPTTNVINATASYASVAESANTIGNATISGRQTYNFATNNPTGYAGGIYKQAYKFITGSFGVVSGSFQKIMSVSSGSSAAWQAVGSISGIANNGEIGIINYGFYLRPATTSNFGTSYGDASSQGLTNIEFSASWNGSTNKIDVFSRYSFNTTGSHIIDVSLYSTSTNLTFEFF